MQAFDRYFKRNNDAAYAILEGDDGDNNGGDDNGGGGTSGGSFDSGS